MSSAVSIDFLEPTSQFQKPVTFLLLDMTKSVGFAEIFIFSTPALMVSVLTIIVHYATSRLI